LHRRSQRGHILITAKEKLEIVNFCGRAACTRPPIPSRAKRGEEQSKFELFLEYTANLQFQH
jgi:hypothetical protein